MILVKRTLNRMTSLEVHREGNFIYFILATETDHRVTRK